MLIETGRKALLLAFMVGQILVGTANAGTKDGTGGNGQVAEFYKLAKAFHQEIKNVYKAKAPNFPIQELTKVMATFSVEADPGPLTLKNGQKVDAINNPNTMTIYLDDVSWAKRDLATRYQIVIHELLGLMKVDDAKYSYSATLAQITRDVLAQKKQKITPLSGTYQFPERFGFTGEDQVDVSTEGISAMSYFFRPTKDPNIYHQQDPDCKITVMSPTVLHMHCSNDNSQLVLRRLSK